MTVIYLYDEQAGKTLQLSLTFFKNMLISVLTVQAPGCAKKLLLQRIFLNIFTGTIVYIKIINPTQYIFT
jgi:hypothetical protein